MYWIATLGAGLCRFDATAGAKDRITCYRIGGNGETDDSQDVMAVFEDRESRLWVGTADGLFRVEGDPGHVVFRRIPISGERKLEIDSLIQDAFGTIWAGTNGWGLYRVSATGVLEPYGRPTVARFIRSLFRDRTGRVWAGSEIGLSLLRLDSQRTTRMVERTYAFAPGLETSVGGIDEDDDGAIWFTTASGLGCVRDGKLKTYTTANGLAQNVLGSLTHDSDGNLWLGTASAGVLTIANTGFTSFDEADGLASNRISSIFEDRSGRVCVTSNLGRNLLLSCLTRERFSSIRPNYPPYIKDFGWGHDRVALQDRDGDWWLATAQGALRFPVTGHLEELARVRPKMVYSAENGLSGTEVFRLFEDSRGDVWVSTLVAGLGVWRRKTEQVENFPNIFGKEQIPSAFAEDRAGNVWIGLYGGGIARSSGGKFIVFGEKDGVPRAHVESMYVDDAGALWAATHAGLVEVDNPAATRPGFRRYGLKDGLASDTVKCVTTDRLGRLYIGTDQGVDRFQPSTHTIRHYSVADGLANEYVEVAYRDRDGDLWFGSGAYGLSRLRPRGDPLPRRLHVYIAGIRVSGLPQAIPELECTSAGGVQLKPGQNHIEIEFSSIHHRAGEVVRFEYKLEGADSSWSASTQQHAVNYANIRPGAYRFVVRQVGAGGNAQTASVDFTVLPYAWQRWWFILAVVVAVATLAHQAHKYRLAQVLRLQRVRTRIATDLHDDIGASLSQIALLSDVAQRQRANGLSVSDPLVRIGDISRELVDSMSDIVWSIHPRCDKAADLIGRMKRFANDMFDAREIKFEFRTCGMGPAMDIDPDVRREVFLVFKESVRNIVRHAQCRRAAVQFQRADGWLLLEVSDDGKGAAGPGGSTGHGLASMAERARRLGGELTVESYNGSGTRVALQIPSTPKVERN